MQLENSFTVPVPVDEAWRVLLDIERIAPCMPGAALDSVTGDDFTGRVKVKLGPINLTYQGKASFIEKDEAAHRAVIDARGKDQRGNGTATATITAKLQGEGATTRVDVLTDLNITGRPAQFGRGVMTDVGNKLLGQFADKLAAQLGEGDAQGDAERADSAAAKATATVTGAAEEIAQSVEQVPGDNVVAEKVRQAGTAARKAAASATDSASGRPAKKQAAKKAAAAAAPAPTETAPITAPVAAGATDTVSIPAVSIPPVSDTAPAASDTAPAASDTAPAASDTTPVAAVGRAPSTPPSGNTAPPGRPATGAPPRSTPTGTAETVRQQPVAEPEPIDLLEVAGGAALARYAAPAAGVGAFLLLLVLVVRRRRR
ncbi:carbon monoxide dehydrogenase subunit G [Geodermatophilus normandii]|uniref:Carbon monoxide dehydrogenase subunit G n=1 Tax=Geodermatophilus normandii TaxID=1137989 RepID=A0A317QGG7_9ACTN|nr:SRPBCC family protein [Geodermatophilus normandii]PWW22362.1 carbon monoxide dehydrogenase subunit G [Geodermatophilus normandii]